MNRSQKIVVVLTLGAVLWQILNPVRSLFCSSNGVCGHWPLFSGWLFGVDSFFVVGVTGFRIVVTLIAGIMAFVIVTPARAA